MKNALLKPGGHAWRHVFMACSKLEAMAIYLVKQACGNDKRACVYAEGLDRPLCTGELASQQSVL